ncbi:MULTISPECIES: WbuC family cupin fold metalloprotein [Yersinia]|uniref:Cupin fold metallo, WbuC family protein n=1 Tax=Yersinia rochesterensis TaxID=1604335 RepID=A0A386HA52_9GAMM|nr:MULTISPECIES: WbuC family cupin fold metalloprotein [Yersinia]AJI86029.1 cupin fold metallo, WbuC family protein [Yersinia frederiksenii Y225]CNH98849.1 WxcM-like%2C C-terminal [Yersinia kristensenii]AIN19383.1 cupin fold metallo, WbuC family protein [Yersinia rochesterensis]AJJ34286.1 cupin fold metallo, WbuC family protein [Yersinia rochesterensis]AYD42473.1 cupin fold metalloprotein, WbuC family [Yersinia rochesterensis]
MKQITQQTLVQLSQQAQQSPRQRANLNFHPQLDDPIQRLAIAMEPETYVRPHRHPHTWELLTALHGSFIVLLFDDAGKVTHRALLGQETAILEIPANVWHAVLSLEEGAVIFEVKHGPYQPITAEYFASWSPAEGEAKVSNLLAWYATADIGARYQ